MTLHYADLFEFIYFLEMNRIEETPTHRFICLKFMYLYVIYLIYNMPYQEKMNKSIVRIEIFKFNELFMTF